MTPFNLVVYIFALIGAIVGIPMIILLLFYIFSCISTGIKSLIESKRQKKVKPQLIVKNGDIVKGEWRRNDNDRGVDVGDAASSKSQDIEGNQSP